MKADSGASKHFIKPTDATVLHSQRQDITTSVIFSDKKKLKTTVTGNLPLPLPSLQKLQWHMSYRA